IALAAVIWVTHRSDVDERGYRSRVMQAAVDWTGVLINMNTGNIAASLQRLQSTSHGQVEAVAVEAVHHDLDAQPGTPRPAEQLPTSIARRTETVMVVATSVSENAGGKPQTVHWNLRLGVSDVDGKLMISRLESIR